MAAPHSPFDPDALDAEKRVMRAGGMAVRDGQDGQAAGRALGRIFRRDAHPPLSSIIAGFWPLPGEIDIRPLLRDLHAAGHPIVLPVTPKRGLPLTFLPWHPGDEMIAERFGTFRPPSGRPPIAPDILLVPLLAFDRRGGRLGYGAGFYDRTLPLFPGRLAIGCAFAAQEVPAVPMGPTDIRLDGIVTEHELIRVSSPV